MEKTKTHQWLNFSLSHKDFLKAMLKKHGKKTKEGYEIKLCWQGFDNTDVHRDNYIEEGNKK